MPDTSQGITDSANRTWMTPDQAADYLGQSVHTLNNWRSQGIGPKYSKATKQVRYHRSWLDQWLEEAAVVPGSPS